MVYSFLTSSYITKSVTTNIVLQFIYLSRIVKTNHTNGHGIIKNISFSILPLLLGLFMILVITWIGGAE
jgi:hypothetical protein